MASAPRRRKQRALRMRIGDTAAGEFKIIRPLLNADEFSAELRACDTSGATAHKGIEYDLAGVGEFCNPVHHELERLLGRMLPALNIADPHGVMAAAVPVPTTFAMQDGNGFPSHSGAVSGKLRRAIGLVPDTQAH